MIHFFNMQCYCIYGLIRYVQILILLVCLLLEAFQKLDSFIIRGL